MTDIKGKPIGKRPGWKKTKTLRVRLRVWLDRNKQK